MRIAIISIIIFLNLDPQKVFAQESGNTLNELASRLEQYYQRHSNDRIILTLSGETFQPADTVWFHAQIMELFTRRLNAYNSILHVELWSPEDEIMVRKKRYKILDNQSHGFLVLPGGAETKSYLIRVFTQTMSDLPEDLIPNQWIYVNAIPHSENEEDTVLVNFEGGLLVSGIVNQGVIRAKPNALYTIISSSEDTISVAKTDQNGVAGFVLKPELGKQYALIGNDNSSTDFPNVTAEGLRLMVSPAKNHFKLNIQATDAYLNANKPKKLNLLIESKGIVYFLLEADISKGYYLSEIPKSTLPDGLVRISVFANSSHPVLTRLVFNPVKEDSMHFSIQDSLIERRAMTKLSMASSKSSEQNCLIKVAYQLDGYATETPFDHPDLHLLKNLDITKVNTQNMNLQLIAAELPDIYNWEKILSDSPKSQSAKAEGLLSYEGVAYNTDGEPLKNTKLHAVLLANDVLYETITDESGVFELVVFDFEEEDFVLMADEGGKLKSIMLVEKSGSPNLHTPEFQTIDDDDSNRLRHITNQVYSYYKQKPQELTTPQPFQLKVEDLEDYSIQLSDYVAFESMEEIFAEIVNGVQVRKNASNNTLRVFMPGKNRYAADHPLFVVDGMPTADESYVLNIPPGEVEEISLLRSLKQTQKYRSIAQNGIIRISTKDQQYKPSPDQRMAKLVGLSANIKPQRFNFPTTQEHKRLPYLDPLLFFNATWLEPNEQEKVEFFSADQVGEFQARLRCFDTEGGYFEDIVHFNVKPSHP